MRAPLAARSRRKSTAFRKSQDRRPPEPTRRQRFCLGTSLTERAGSDHTVQGGKAAYPPALLPAGPWSRRSASTPPVALRLRPAHVRPTHTPQAGPRREHSSPSQTGKPPREPLEGRQRGQTRWGRKIQTAFSEKFNPRRGRQWKNDSRGPANFPPRLSTPTPSLSPCPGQGPMAHCLEIQDLSSRSLSLRVCLSSGCCNKYHRRCSLSHRSGCLRVLEPGKSGFKVSAG